MKTSLDYSIDWSTGVARVHTPSCPVVRALADKGEPVLTMLECERPIEQAMPVVYELHSCLEEEPQ